jgi:hypothetical protein
MLLSGCFGNEDKTVTVEVSTGKAIEAVEWAKEICYKGVVYVEFYGNSNSKLPWGGVKYNTNGTVSTCKIIPK